MNNQKKKYQDIEIQYAALTAICNCLVLTMITIAGYGVFLLTNSLYQIYVALTLLTIY